ncbi:putative zinc-binding domain-containing protein, partial [Dysosmobacter welbionis]
DYGHHHRLPGHHAVHLCPRQLLERGAGPVSVHLRRDDRCSHCHPPQQPSADRHSHQSDEAEGADHPHHHRHSGRHGVHGIPAVLLHHPGADRRP